MASPCICLKPNKDIAPLICVVPQNGSTSISSAKAKLASTSATKKPRVLNNIRDIKLPQRALYLDSDRRPLITFPMTQEISNNFNLARMTKINQQILDGYLDPSAAISALSVFPYSKKTDETVNEDEEDDVVYILQLPDLESECPVHHQVIKTPRFYCHSYKNSRKKELSTEPKRGPGPLNKPKPWLLSRHTDFDLLSQW